MSDTYPIEAPNITLTLRTDRFDTEAPPLRFLRWRTAPIAANSIPVEPTAEEAPSSVDTERRSR